MFLKLTKIDNSLKIYNTEFIRSIYKNDDQYTVVELEYGTDVVKERVEEIMEMLKGCD